ncbi:uncharacterized protein [Euwallacea fornicatus]|uniref:uncharacterized protein n=1 Tax=Euwallacea fornicatus TaxID=995702 RepID=UPI00338DFE89
MAAYSNVEYADILFMYGRADGNAAAAQRLYRERFPQRRVPNVKVFANTYRRMSETGNLYHQDPRPNNQKYHAEVDVQIFNTFEAEPTTSVRKVAEQLNVSTWKVWSVLHSEKLHPFHYTPVQGLEEGDPIRRTHFCRFILHADIEDGRFLRRILWTDESKFSREGVTNFHNLHYWAEENPHMKKETSFQHKFSVNVWAGIIGRLLIGPYFLPDNLNGENYLEFLRNHLPDILDDIPLDVRTEIIFQNDGCPAHYRKTIREFLNNQFPERWIGRNGPILWPARSPDLTPVDYHIWGRMKELVYNEEIHDRDHLIQKINRAAKVMKVEMKLGVTTTEMRRRCRCCIRNGGSYFEHNN